MPVPTKSTTNEATKPVTKAVVVDVPVVAAAVPAKAATVVASPEVKAVAATTSVATAVAPKVEAKAKVEGGRDRSAIVLLILSLRDNEADTARDAAIRLGTLPLDVEAVDALMAAVRNQDNFFHPVVRAAAAQSLGRIGDRRAVDALIEATRDSMAEASEEAVTALGLLGDAKALPALTAIVANDQGYYLETVRKSAAKALEQIKGKKA
jgi:hypothetical protein